ncbi:pentapeptide repeat-containing protein, partial [bacterium]|nr:pentapeptide repeat-containing protein [bacterium]
MPVCSWPGKDGKPLRFDSEKLRDIKFVSRGQSSTALHLPWPSGSLSHPSDLAIVLSVLADLSRLLGVPFDLSSSDMSHADLGFADFRGADLHGAAMIGTDLHQADLRKANLRNANLAGARLDEADLTGASAREARLSYAYLVDANLTGVDFRWAHLTNAKLTRSKCAGAGFLDADLSSADLGEANLFEADLRGVDMRNASLLRANLRDVEFDRGRFINPVLRVIPGPLARLFFEPEYRSRFLGVMIDEAYGSWRFMHFVRYRVAVESTQSLWPKWWLTATKHFCGMGHRLSNLIAWAALVVL